MASLISIQKDDKIIFNKQIVNYLNPDYLYIPYEKGFQLNVKNKEYVYKESILLTKDDTYIYSPISGTILGSCEMLVNKKKVSSIVIENDFKEKTKNPKGVKKQINDITKAEATPLIKKYNAFKGDIEGKVIIVNGIDSECYEATFSSIINEYSNYILETIDALYTIFNAEKCYLAIKNNHSENIDLLVNQIGTYPNIDLKLLPDLYPLGLREFLIEELVMPKYHEQGIIYLTVEDIYAIYNVLRKKRPITEKLVTVSGNLLSRSKVINVKLGTTLKDILLNNFKILSDDYKIIINGLLSGYEVDSLDMVITNEIRSIFINALNTEPEAKCINCGMCHTKCPVGADPRNNYRLDKCVKCGICTYICPVKINFKRKLEKINE